MCFVLDDCVTKIGTPFFKVHLYHRKTDQLGNSPVCYEIHSIDNDEEKCLCAFEALKLWLNVKKQLVGNFQKDDYIFNLVIDHAKSILNEKEIVGELAVGGAIRSNKTK